MTLGATILARRLKCGLSQEKAAFLAGVSERQWRRWEHDEASPPVDTLVTICTVLGVEITALLAESR